MKLTNAQLSALPERNDYVNEILPCGTTVRHRIAPQFAVYKPAPEDVLLFRDADGAWIVDYHLEGGPYKRRAPF